MSLGTDWELTLIGMCATPPTTAWRALLSKDTIKLCATCCFLEDDDDAFPPPLSTQKGNRKKAGLFNFLFNLKAICSDSSRGTFFLCRVFKEESIPFL